MKHIKFRAWNYKKMIYNVAVRNSLIVNHKDSFTYQNGEANYKIMMFTGLLDKNGNEIYEGDILTDGALTGHVYWINSYFAWHGQVLGIDDTEQEEMQLEMIGNIFNNPELVKNHLIKM